MGTVKYTGPVASFHCPTNAEIRSLKVHFSPKQEGSGDPSPENVREIVGWDGVEVYHWTSTSVSTSSVPSEYKKVEYLESTGTQYIDTTIIPKMNYTRWEFSLQFTNISGTQLVGNGYVNRFALRLISNKLSASIGSNYLDFNINADTVTTYNAILQTGQSAFAEVNGVKLTDWQIPEIPAVSIALFERHQQSGNHYDYPCKCRIFKSKIYQSGELVQNLIPCRRKSDNKPGMYDTVSGEFFTNQGTGEFICGPDVGETVEYEFGVLGKNKFDSSTVVIVDQKAKNANGAEITAADNKYNSNYIPVASSTIYTISGLKTDSTTKGYQRIYFYTQDQQWIKRSDYYLTSSFSFTTPSNCSYIQIQGCEKETYTDIQLELGSTATTYEPYDPKHTVYGGWVDLISGEVYEEWHKIVADGVNVKANSSYNEPDYNRFGAGIVYCSPIGISYNNTEKPVKCDILPVNPGGYGSLPDVDQLIAPYAGQLYVVFYIGKISEHPEITTSDQRKEFTNLWLQEHPTTILYKLRNPETYYIAPIQLQTFLGTNNVWSNADYVEVEYDLHETQSILARKQFIVANQPHIVKPAAAPLQNFVTDVAAPLKECKVYFGPVQEGTGDPSPNNARPITGWTGINVYAAGENLIPTNYEAVEGKWKPTQGVISTSVYNMGQFPAPPTLIQYQSETTGITYFGFMDGPIQSGEPVYDVITMSNRSAYRFDNTDGHRYALITANREAVDSCKVIISVGHTYKAYSEPSGTAIPITFPTEAGTVYGGYVDLLTGEVWNTFQQIILDGDETLNVGYSSYNGTDGTNRYVIVPNHGCGTSTARGCCDKAKLYNENVWGYPNTHRWGFTLNANTQLHIDFDNATVGITAETEDRTAAIKTWLSNNPMTFYIPRKNPELVGTLTPTQLKTLRGTNNIWSNSNDNIEVAYWSH